jgi:hypothetical protein
MNKLDLLRCIAALALVATGLRAQAHGDEPHGDAPHPVAPVSVALPRFETATDTFEAVGRLQAGALTLFIQRFETSEPVVQAQVELESGELKAVAVYQPGTGSYVVDAPAFVAALARPGSHPVLITVLAGSEADLLQATLDIAAPPAQGGPAPARQPLILWVAGGALALLVGAAAGLALRRHRVRTAGGGQ